MMANSHRIATGLRTGHSIRQTQPRTSSSAHTHTASLVARHNVAEARRYRRIESAQCIYALPGACTDERACPRALALAFRNRRLLSLQPVATFGLPETQSCL